MYVSKKKAIILCLFISCMCVAVCAQSSSSIPKLDAWGQKILEVFSSVWLKAVCAVAFIVECIVYLTVGKNEGGMFKKFAPWFIGTILLLCATSIVQFFFADADFKFTLLHTLHAALCMV